MVMLMVVTVGVLPMLPMVVVVMVMPAQPGGRGSRALRFRGPRRGSPTPLLLPLLPIPCLLRRRRLLCPLRCRVHLALLLHHLLAVPLRVAQAAAAAAGEAAAGADGPPLGAGHSARSAAHHPGIGVGALGGHRVILPARPRPLAAAAGAAAGRAARCCAAAVLHAVLRRRVPRRAAPAGAPCPAAMAAAAAGLADARPCAATVAPPQAGTSTQPHRPLPQRPQRCRGRESRRQQGAECCKCSRPHGGRAVLHEGLGSRQELRPGGRHLRGRGERGVGYC